MSTKTTIKRIALVAAVAAAFGGLSTVAANATAGTSTIVVNAGGSGTTGSGTNTVTTSAVTSTYVSAAITFTGDANNATQITSSGVGTLNVPSIAAATNNVATTGITSTGFTAFEADTTTAVPGTSAHTLGNLTGTSGVGAVTFAAYSATAGTQTISVASSTSTSTLTITWGAAPVFSSANSYAYVIDTGTAVSAVQTIAATNPTADATTAQTKGSGTPTQVAVIKVRLLDNEPTPVGLASKTVSASISGAGLLEGTGSNIATSGFVATPAAVASSTTDGSGYAAFSVLNSGVAGTGTITLSYTDANGVVNSLGSHVVVFYNTTPASFKVTQNLKVGTAGVALGVAISAANSGATVATTPAIEIQALDASGNIVGGLTGFTAVSSNTNVLLNTIAVAEDTSSAANAAGAGNYIVQPTFAAGAVSGSSATLTVTWTSTDGLTKVSAAPVTFTVGGTTISTLTLKSDADSYTPGQKVTLTLTATDSSGNPVADGNYGVWGNTATNGAITPVTASAQLTSNPFAAGSSSTTAPAAPSYEVVGGVATTTIYAPYTDGTVSLTSTLGTTNSGLATALQGTTLATSFTVATGASTASAAATDAANEATDAANAATDAANAATSAAQDAGAKADAALAAVTALSAKITVLAAQIAKIVKKLKA
jgi:hypothetical protein